MISASPILRRTDGSVLWMEEKYTDIGPLLSDTAVPFQIGVFDLNEAPPSWDVVATALRGR